MKPLKSETSQSGAETVARSILRNHGRAALRLLVDGLVEQRPLVDIARDMGVSRQRVHQWQTQMAVVVRTVTMQPGVMDVLNGQKRLFSEEE